MVYLITLQLIHLDLYFSQILTKEPSALDSTQQNIFKRKNTIVQSVSWNHVP